MTRALAFGLCLAAVTSSPVSAAGVAVTFSADDGVQIAGTLWEPGARAAAAVIMVPGPLHGRGAWTRLGDQLAARGFVALAIDLRGQGGSGGGDPGEDRTAYVRDVAAAVHFLQSRPDVQVGAIGIAGATLGATLAVMAAGVSPSVRALALLSPTLDFRGLKIEDALKRVGDRAALLVASSEDAYSARSARELAQTGPGTRELQLLEGAGNGTRMLASRPDLVGTLVDWFSRTLL